jgi:DNA modification methylase
VLDPFMGSGSTGVAALRGGWDFIGVEREKAYYLISERRLLAERVLALRRRHCRG